MTHQDQSASSTEAVALLADMIPLVRYAQLLAFKRVAALCTAGDDARLGESCVLGEGDDMETADRKLRAGVELLNRLEAVAGLGPDSGRSSSVSDIYEASHPEVDATWQRYTKGGIHPLAGQTVQIPTQLHEDVFALARYTLALAFCRAAGARHGPVLEETGADGRPADDHQEVARKLQAAFKLTLLLGIGLSTQDRTSRPEENFEKLRLRVNEAMRRFDAEPAEA